MNRRDRRRAEAQRRAKMKRFYDDIDSDIERDGRSVLCVGGGEEDALPFAYTVGNALKGLPELLIIGTAKGGLLNDLSEKMIERDAAFDDGELVMLGGKFPVKIINADRRACNEYTIQVGQALGHEDYAVQQVLAPDRDGHYPDDPECAAPLFERARGRTVFSTLKNEMNARAHEKRKCADA